MHLQIFFLQGEGSVVLTCFSTLQIPFLKKWVFSLLLLQTANRRSVSAGTIFKPNPTCILLFQQKTPPELLLACLTVSLSLWAWNPPQNHHSTNLRTKRIVRIAARIFGLGKKIGEHGKWKSNKPFNNKSAVPQTTSEIRQAPKTSNSRRKWWWWRSGRTKRQKKLRLFTLLLASQNQHRQMRNKKQN